MEHVSTALRRGLRKIPRRSRLAPLDPDAFLLWAWNNGPRHPGTGPLTLDDLLFELGNGCPEITMATLHRDYVHLAALVRRNQRLGIDPFEGVR